jgi:hypothetical protein
MYDPITKGVHLTRDVTWLRRMYFNKAAEVGEGTATEISQPYPTILTADLSLKPSDDAGDDAMENANEDVDDHDLAVNEDAEEPTAEEETTTQADDEPHAEEEETVIANNAASTITRSGRQVAPPSFLRDNYELGSIGAAFDNHSWHVEQHEMMLVGAGIGGGFLNTNELHTLKYEEAMKSNEKNMWLKALEEEHRKRKNISAEIASTNNLLRLVIMQ